jgi:hypothetical protein
MQKIMFYILSKSRKNRRTAAGLSLWLLTQLYQAETNERCYCENELDMAEDEYAGVSQEQYALLEDNYIVSAHALAFLHCAISDLEYAY